jgi:hypothetical protein
MKKVYTVAALFVVAFVVLAVLLGGSVGGAFVILAILVFGTMSFIFCGVPTGNSRMSERDPRTQAIIEYNRADCAATLELFESLWGPLGSPESLYANE